MFNKCQSGLYPLPLTAHPKIEKFRLGVEISNFRRKDWVAPAIKVVHLAEIYKKVHGLLSLISKRFAGKVRKAVDNGSPRKYPLDAVSTLFGFLSKTREDTLKSPMVNLVYLAEIYKEVHEHFPRISKRMHYKNTRCTLFHRKYAPKIYSTLQVITSDFYVS